jgi:hypothetical protein
MYMRTCVHVYMCTWVHGYMCTCIHVYMYTCVHVYMCTCVHGLYMGTWVHVYIFVKNKLMSNVLERPVIAGLRARCNCVLLAATIGNFFDQFVRK